MNYRYSTTENLVKAYAFEASRENREDAELTKANIRKELNRRFYAFMNLLDDQQTVDNPQGTLNYLLGK